MLGPVKGPKVAQRTSRTPTENFIESLDWFMTDRRVSHEELARRMRSLGFGWYRRAVYRVLRKERRVSLDELIGLAVALETTATMLLRPAGPTDVMNFDVGFRIGSSEPLSAPQYTDLIEEVHPRDRLPKTHATSFPDEDSEEQVSFGIRTMDWLRQQILKVARTEYLAANPDSDLGSLTDAEISAFVLDTVSEGRTTADK